MGRTCRNTGANRPMPISSPTLPQPKPRHCLPPPNPKHPNPNHPRHASNTQTDSALADSREREMATSSPAQPCVANCAKSARESHGVAGQKNYVLTGSMIYCAITPPLDALRVDVNETRARIAETRIALGSTTVGSRPTRVRVGEPLSNWARRTTAGRQSFCGVTAIAPFCPSDLARRSDISRSDRTGRPPLGRIAGRTTL